MDIKLYLAVLRRHAQALTVGVGFALVLAVFASIQLGELPTLKLKLRPTYATTSLIHVTQNGFPVGRTTLVDPGDPVDSLGRSTSRFADPDRFEYLARLYAELANSETVRAQVLGSRGVQRGDLLILDDGETEGKYTAAAITSDQERQLPIVSIVSEASSKREAIAIARRATVALTGYISRTQVKAGIKASERVQLAVIDRPDRAKRIKDRPVVIPLAVFLLVLAGTVFLVFFRENLARDTASSESGSLEPVAELAGARARSGSASPASQRRPEQADGAGAPSSPLEAETEMDERLGGGSRAEGQTWAVKASEPVGQTEAVGES